MSDTAARSRAGVATMLARRRVALGFLVAALALVMASPTWASWRLGLLVALVGEGIRLWAAGHIEKSREVTRSGPYRWMPHPLYVGSSVIALGVVLASRSWVLGLVVAIYFVATVTAAIRTEEASLRRDFGDTYDRYRRAEAEPMPRRFSAARAWRNREYRAIVGLFAGFALLALKIGVNL